MTAKMKRREFITLLGGASTNQRGFLWPGINAKTLLRST